MSEIVRPDWNEFAERTRGRFLVCPCGQVVSGYRMKKGHWQEGHFDYEQIDKYHTAYVYPQEVKDE